MYNRLIRFVSFALCILFLSINARSQTYPSPTLNAPTILGVINGSNAPSGSVGELILTNTGSTTITSNVLTNIASMTLPPGDWVVSGGILFVGASGNIGNAAAGVSTTSATFGSSGTYCQLTATFSAYACALPATRFSITSSTTVYVVALAAYSTGTVSVSGAVQARRVH